MSSSDRTVHARKGETELVRYDRAGKWFCEQSCERRAVKLSEAVMIASQWLTEPGANVFFDRPGGNSFDAKVRKATAL